MHASPLVQFWPKLDNSLETHCDVFASYQILRRWGKARSFVKGRKLNYFLAFLNTSTDRDSVKYGMHYGLVAFTLDYSIYTYIL